MIATSGLSSMTGARSGLLRRLPAPRVLPGRGLDFLDPWGNHIQVVEYRDVQFSKVGGVLRLLGVNSAKTEEALHEIREKGLAP